VIVAPRAVTLFVRATALHRSLPAPGHDRVNAERLRHRRGGCRDAVPAQRLPEPGLALSAVGTDAGFACPALKLDKLASTFVPTFAYEFNDDNAPQRYLPPVSFPYGAAHASEIQYLFDLPTAPIAGTLPSNRRRWRPACGATGRTSRRAAGRPRQTSRGGRASTATARRCSRSHRPSHRSKRASRRSIGARSGIKPGSPRGHLKIPRRCRPSRPAPTAPPSPSATSASSMRRRNAQRIALGYRARPLSLHEQGTAVTLCANIGALREAVTRVLMSKQASRRRTHGARDSLSRAQAESVGQAPGPKLATS
jgi:hypothetical protein